MVMQPQAGKLQLIPIEHLLLNSFLVLRESLSRTGDDYEYTMELPLTKMSVKLKIQCKNSPIASDGILICPIISASGK